jgi:AcrR family transcriptional regulator
MDDIARELGMSKKTIYQSVDNKADLVRLAMQDYLEEEQNHLQQILASSKNSIDEMIKMVAYFSNQIREFNPSALYDMKKHYPDTWKIFNDHQFHNVLNRIKSNLEGGVKEGVYRKELNTEVIARIYIGGIDILLNQDFFPARSFVFLDIYNEYLHYHLRGIVSPEGLKILEENNLFKK